MLAGSRRQSGAPGLAADPLGSWPEFARELGAASTVGEIHARLCAFLTEAAGADSMLVSSYDAPTQIRTYSFVWSRAGTADLSAHPPCFLADDPHSRALLHSRTVVAPVAKGTMVVAPLVAAGRTFGAVELVLGGRATPTAETVSLVEVAVQLAALATTGVCAGERERGLRESLEVLAREFDTTVNERLRELDAKNEELEAFASTVAHDLRAPLRAVFDLTQRIVARQGGRLGASELADLQAVGASSLQMSRLVEDLLRFARAAHVGLARERVDVTAIAKTILAELAARDPGRAADLAVDEGIVVNADRATVTLLLQNLLQNAWKFSSRKLLTRIHVGRGREDGEDVIFVEDHGAGFEPQQANRLFKPFGRLHAAHEFDGTGIGLATAARIVARHGGRIWARGRPGEGATFYLTLAPAAASA